MKEKNRIKADRPGGKAEATKSLNRMSEPAASVRVHSTTDVRRASTRPKRVLLEAALQYARRGWYVFPLKARSKAPLTPHGHKDATNDEATICDWWVEWPKANIGIDCERSGLVVVDVDAGRGGLETWKEISPGTTTLTSKTGNDGRHYCFARPEGAIILSSTDKLGKGIDVKANGYIVAPPSTHPNGNPYKWINGLDPAPLPAVLLARMTPKPRAPARPPANHRNNGHQHANDVSRAEAALSRLAKQRADDYTAWYQVGMSLRELGDDGLGLWKQWSHQSSKFKNGECANKWATFDENDRTDKLTLGSLFHWADEDDPPQRRGRTRRDGSRGNGASAPASTQGRRRSKAAKAEGKPRIELLDEAPKTMTRPLALINGEAYAATWLHVSVTTSKGSKTEQRLIVASRRKIFGYDGAMLGDLPFGVHLSEVPPNEKLLSAGGMKRLLQRDMPDPVSVFKCVADVASRFIDFERSLASQRTMSELVACYVLSTYLLDAFNVTGYLWPNGEWGTGKTQLLLLIGEMAYLGQVILSGGSYPTLRDMADYGATLCFDDAESVMDTSLDPDKRALLLAGNRRGAYIPIKEPIGGGRAWRTRRVNAFCPRCFSAIRLPDNVLASRSIVIPLARTTDRKRGNTDVLEYDEWPHDRRRLIDDLWLLALEHLPKLAEYEKTVAKNSALTGRILEPWRAVLAVAKWLQKHGADGLYDRLARLSVAYQSERPNLEGGNLARLVLESLCGLWNDRNDGCDGCDTSKTPMHVSTSDFVKKVAGAARKADADIPTDEINSVRVGRILGRLRFKPDRTAADRGWIISRRWLEKQAQAHSITPAWMNRHIRHKRHKRQRRKS